MTSNHHFFYTPLICLVVISLLQSAWYHSLDLDDYRDDEGRNLLTLNAIECPDSDIAVMATATYFFSDKHLEQSYVDTLAPLLHVNGQECGQMSYDASRHLYFSKVRPQKGDIINIAAQYNGKVVSTTDTMPQQPKIEDWSYTVQGPMHVYNDDDLVYTYHLTFTDPANEKNYYFLQYDTPNKMEEPFMGERRFTQEYVFQKLANTVNKYLPQWEPYSPYGLPFSDEGIDGETHTLVVQEIVQQQPLRQLGQTSLHRKFQLFAISQAYYRYLVSVICLTGSSTLHSAMIDLGVAEHMAAFSNVEGGIGILGCYAEDSKTVTIPLKN